MNTLLTILGVTLGASLVGGFYAARLLHEDCHLNLSERLVHAGKIGLLTGLWFGLSAGPWFLLTGFTGFIGARIYCTFLYQRRLVRLGFAPEEPMSTRPRRCSA
jgi:hypothetical protein